MCFTAGASAFSFAVGTISSFVIAHHCKYVLALNCVFIALMQLAEYFMHQREDNHTSTLSAALLVALQPIASLCTALFYGAKLASPPLQLGIAALHTLLSVDFLRIISKHKIRTKKVCSKRFPWCRLRWGFLELHHPSIMTYFLCMLANPRVDEGYKSILMGSAVMSLLLEDPTTAGSLWCFLCDILLPVLALRSAYGK